MPPFELQFRLAQIPELAARYDADGDIEAVRIGRTARARGFFTKPEFVTVCAWKTVRSKPRVATNTPTEIEEATRLALATESEALRIQVPMALCGVSWGTASVLLHLAHRDPYPIIDFQALEALGRPGLSAYTLPLWLAYVACCRQLAGRAAVDLRTLDQAMWQWSSERSLNAARLRLA